jgi:Raf kinase inhibitor-like YbhB/YbcL family protein
LVIVAVVAVILVLARAGHKLSKQDQSKGVGNKGMKLTSTAFANSEAIPVRFSCQGEKINPPLAISGVPEGVGSLALVVDDPDAPGGTFDHWVMWNLPADTPGIPENWSPEPGVSVGANGMGQAEWFPPCPPNGTHHYHFKLYALDSKLSLATGAAKARLEQAMEGHVVAQTELVGTYTKQ